MLINLQKRLLSSIEAFHRTLRAHRRSLQKLADKPPTQASRENSPQLWRQRQMALEEACAADDVRAELGEDDVEAEQEDTLEAATAPAATGPARPSSQELGLVDQMECGGGDNLGGSGCIADRAEQPAYPEGQPARADAWLQGARVDPFPPSTCRATPVLQLRPTV